MEELSLYSFLLDNPEYDGEEIIKALKKDGRKYSFIVYDERRARLNENNRYGEVKNYTYGWDIPDKEFFLVWLKELGDSVKKK